MTSIPCTIQLATRTMALSRRMSPRAAQGGGGGGGLRTPLLGGGAVRRLQGWLRLSDTVPARESGRVGFFKFGNKDAEGAGIYGSQSREDFDRDDIEQYRFLVLSKHMWLAKASDEEVVLTSSKVKLLNAISFDEGRPDYPSMSRE